MNLETTVAYKVLFERLFRTLGNVGRKPVSFAYMLGGEDAAEGIRTVTVDMCKKQAAGKFNHGFYMLSIYSAYANLKHFQGLELILQKHLALAFHGRSTSSIS
jgi:hypothetical protein